MTAKLRKKTAAQFKAASAKRHSAVLPDLLVTIRVNTEPLARALRSMSGAAQRLGHAHARFNQSMYPPPWTSA